MGIPGTRVGGIRHNGLNVFAHWEQCEVPGRIATGIGAELVEVAGSMAIRRCIIVVELLRIRYGVNQRIRSAHRSGTENKIGMPYTSCIQGRFPVYPDMSK